MGVSIEFTLQTVTPLVLWKSYAALASGGWGVFFQNDDDNGDTYNHDSHSATQLARAKTHTLPPKCDLFFFSDSKLKGSVSKHSTEDQTFFRCSEMI